MSKREINPDLCVLDNKTALAEAAAELFANEAQSAIKKRGRFLVALSGGSTPQTMFSLLAAPPYQTAVDWSAVYVFWGDERMVAADDPGSNYFHARRLLLDHVPVPAAQIKRIRGEMPVGEAAVDYERQLQSMANAGRAWPNFDLSIMGMGADGHTASLFPGSEVLDEAEKAVVAVSAEYQGRPSGRITLTAPVFNDSRQVMFLVSGADKAAALVNVLYGPPNIQAWPAQIIQPHTGRLTWLVDQAAASLLASD